MRVESHNELGAGPLIVLQGADPAPLVDQRLSRILAQTLDLSDGSDALASLAGSTDPHVGPTRSSLLAPIRVRPGMRVLELGCGAGALTRGLADRGARVTAVEPSIAMARLAADRTRDLSEVRILAAPVATWARSRPGTGDRHDMVVVAPIGSGTLAGTAPIGPDELLPIATQVLEPEGALVVAVSNPLGIAALAGAPTAVLPPIELSSGLSGISPSPWTMTGARLTEQLASLGLGEQVVFAVFPDLVAPQVMLTAALLESAEGQRLAKAFMRDVARLPDGAGLRSDPRRLAHVAMGSGLGLALASSVLVVASRSRAMLDATVKPGHLFVLPSPVKGARWRRTRVLLGGPGSWNLGPLDPGSVTEVVDGPLRMRDVSSRVVIGTNAEDLLVESLLAEGLDGVRSSALLAAWWTAARSIASVPDDGGWQFDVGPRNFVIDDDGAWHFVDRELSVLERPPEDVHAWRAMVFLITDRIIPFGVIPGVPPALTVREATTLLLDRIGVPVVDGGEERWIAFESEVQQRIRPAVPSARHEADALRTICGWRLDRTLAGTSADQLRSLADQVADLQGRLGIMADALTVAEARAEQAETVAAAADMRAETATTRYWETQRLHGEAEARARLAEDTLLRLAEQAREQDSRPRPREPLGPRLHPALGKAQGFIGRARAGRTPDAGFDGDWYRARYPDVGRSGMDPWRHWRQHGADEQRDPGPWFSTAWYLATYPDVAAAAIDPLAHYRRFGRTEGRHPAQPVVDGDPPPPDIVDALTGQRLLAIYDVDPPAATNEALSRYPGHEPPVRPSQLPIDAADPRAITLQGRRARAYGFDGLCFQSRWQDRGPYEVLSWLARRDADVGPFVIWWVNAGSELDRERTVAILRALAGPRSLRDEGRPVLVLDGQAGWVAALARSVRVLAGEQQMPVPRVLAVRPPIPDPALATVIDGWVRGQPDRSLMEHLDRQVLAPADDVLVVDHAAVWPVLSFPSDGLGDVPVVLSGWDETRAPGTARPIVIDLVTADSYGRWLASELDRSRSGPLGGLVLVDGWNRWAVGASLVRDQGRGPDLLATTRAVRLRLPEGPVTP